MPKIECPDCGHENTEPDVVESNCFDIHCEGCQNEFGVSVKWQPVYSTSSIVMVDCLECGEKVRGSESKRYPKPQKYKDTPSEDYNLCRDCYTKQTTMDLKKSLSWKGKL